MELSTLEVRVLSALAQRGPCAASTIMPHIEGLDSKAQLKGTLEGLEKKQAAKYQSNGQWTMPAAIKKKVLDGEIKAPAAQVPTPPAVDVKPAPVSVKPKVAVKQKPAAPAASKQETVKVPVLQMSEPAKSLSPLQALRSSLPQGVELTMNNQETFLCWNALVFQVEGEGLDTTLTAIRTLQQSMMEPACN